MKTVVFLMALALTGCEEEAKVTNVSDTTATQCDAAAYQSFVGKSREELTIPEELTVRMLRVGQMRTQDYNPNRLNIEADANGTVTRVFCG